jgi:hypothetical protein
MGEIDDNDLNLANRMAAGVLNNPEDPDRPLSAKRLRERNERLDRKNPRWREELAEANLRSLQAMQENQRRWWQEHPEELERKIRAESKSLAKAELEHMMENDPETVVAALQTIRDDVIQQKAQPQQPQPQRTRKPSVSTLIARAEKKGKTVTSVTAPDGTVLHFGELAPTEASNPWLADLKVMKQ